SIIRELEKTGIGWGRNRYELWIASTRKRFDEVDTVRELVVMFDQLFSIIPPDEQYTPKVIMEGLGALGPQPLLDSFPPPRTGLGWSEHRTAERG
ncbi:MAG: hypothetical protein MUO38_10790, partial [Anaerolineales bacterium]|nr:hypothetical protein [Anaerolineales bacterium]